MNRALIESVARQAALAQPRRSTPPSSRTSANRVIVALIESALQAWEQEKKRFFEVADRLASSREAEDQKRLKEELARMTFGE